MAVIHFAADTLVGESTAKPQNYSRNKLTNTRTLLEAMQDAGVRCIVFFNAPQPSQLGTIVATIFAWDRRPDRAPHRLIKDRAAFVTAVLGVRGNRCPDPRLRDELTEAPATASEAR